MKETIKEELIVQISNILNDTGAYNKIDFLIWKLSNYKLDYDKLHYNYDCDIEEFIVDKIAEALSDL